MKKILFFLFIAVCINAKAQTDTTLYKLHFNKALSFSDEKNYEKAIEEFSASIEYAKDKSTAYFNRAMCYYFSGDIENSVSDYKTALEENPEFSSAYINLAIIYSADKKDEEAVSLLNSALEKENIKHKDELYFSRGIAFFNMKRYDESINDLNSSVSINDTDANVYNYLGCAYQKVNRLNEAISAFVKSIELDPADTSACLNLGKLYSKQNDHSNALVYFIKAVNNGSSDADLFMAMGEEYQGINDYENAVKNFVKAFEIDSKRIEAMESAANNSINNGNYLDAIKYCTKMIDAGYRLMEAYSNRGYCYQKLKDNKKALVELHKALEIEPENYFLLRYIAAIQLYVKDFNSAENNYKKIVALCTKELKENPKSIPALKNRANAYDELEEYELALKDYYAILKIDSSNSDALKEIERLSR